MWLKFPMNIKTQVCMKQHPISSQLGQKRQAVKYPPLYVWAGSGAMVLKRYEYKEMFSDMHPQTVVVQILILPQVNKYLEELIN